MKELMGTMKDLMGAMSDLTGAMSDLAGAMTGLMGAMKNLNGAMKDETSMACVQHCADKSLPWLRSAAFQRSSTISGHLPVSLLSIIRPPMCCCSRCMYDALQ